MIQYGLKFVALGDYWLWWLLPPALALGLTLISLALIGFGLESRFEPTLRR
jgi:ABC-type dipeptide/oligopeptide/nickel transport system permease subunit